jgi:anti-sigma factor RsiW
VIGPDARRERAQALMMAALDGEIPAAERAELDELLASEPELAHEWRRFARLKEVTAGMRLKHPPEEIWDRYWVSTYRRAERGLAWILLSAGAIVLAAYWAWQAAGALLDQLMEDANTPVAIRLAIAAVIVGAVILAVSVIREKIFTNRRDPYQREIIR